jgi:hypothetical protein
MLFSCRHRDEKRQFPSLRTPIASTYAVSVSMLVKISFNYHFSITLYFSLSLHFSLLLIIDHFKQ